METPSATNPLSYGRSGTNWRRIARRFAGAMLAAAVALVLGVAAMWLGLRAGARLQVTPSGSVEPVGGVPPLADYLFDAFRVERRSADGSNHVGLFPFAPAARSGASIAAGSPFAEPGVKHVYTVSAVRTGGGKRVPLREQTVLKPLMPPTELQVFLTDADFKRTGNRGLKLVCKGGRTSSRSFQGEGEPPIVRRVRVQADRGAGWKDIYLGPFTGSHLPLPDDARLTDSFRIRRENVVTADGSLLASDYSAPAGIRAPGAPLRVWIWNNAPHELNVLNLAWERDRGVATHFAVQHRLSAGDKREDAAAATPWRDAAMTFAGRNHFYLTFSDERPDDRVSDKALGGLLDGRKYDFRVRAEVRLDGPAREVVVRNIGDAHGPADDGQVVASEWVELLGVVNPALSPTHVNALAVAPERPGEQPTVRVEWRDHRTHQLGTGYLIERRLADGDEWQEAGRAPGGAESFRDRGVDPDATYFYRVTPTQDGVAADGATVGGHAARHRMPYPTHSDDVTLRIEAETNAPDAAYSR